MNNILYVGKYVFNRTVSRHFHRSWELIYCTSGRGRLVFEDHVLPYGVNDVAVIPPMVPHTNLSETGVTNIYMNLTDASLPYRAPALVRGDPNGFLLDAFSASFYYFAEASAGHPLLPLYGQLVAALLSSEGAAPRHGGIARQIENHILHHFPDCAYDLNAYLQSLPFNTEYLRKLFKKETGQTPLQYLTDKRLTYAASLLSTICGAKNISETACQCGFQDPLYFSRLFKKRFGVSPRRYSPEAAGTAGDALKITL